MNKLIYNYGTEPFPFLASGFIGVMSGSRGCGKSSISEPIMAAAITGESISSWIMKYDSKKDKCGAVYNIDTELPELLIEKSVDRIYHYCSPYISRKQFDKIYEHVNLVDEITFEKKREAFYRILERPFDLMIIDNLSGLCDPTDGNGSVELFNNCNAAAKQCGGILLAINHLNKEKVSRGWVGRRFEEWGSAVLNLEKFTTQGVTVISSDKCRLGNLPTFDFSINDAMEVVPGLTMPFPTS